MIKLTKKVNVIAKSVAIIILIISALVAIKVYKLYQAISPNAIEYWQVSNENNQLTISHELWKEVLASYLVINSERNNRTFNYKEVSTQDKNKLSAYLTKLQAIDPRTYNKNEQLAYWINLYNALTVQVILTHYPIDSIKEIGDGYTGPWNLPLAKIAEQTVTLNQIEHGILRAIWQDNRIHYAINCASIGCPDLSVRPFSSVNINHQLDTMAYRFINQHKAVQFIEKTLVISSIYDWFSDDFGESHSDIIKHLTQYSKPELKKELENYSGEINFEYNWKLNSP
jgi:hypothetical protein